MTTTPERIKKLPNASRKEIPKAKAKIKASLPLLDAQEIRRYKIPYNEAVVLELEEEGSHGVSEYLKFLFNLDEENRMAAGSNSVIYYTPKLKDNIDLIDYLRDLLTDFFKHKIPASTKAQSLINAGLTIEKLSWEWWWIADRLYLTAFLTIKEIKDSKSQLCMLTIIRYIYAWFLFYKMKNPRAALEHVREAHRDSRGKSWNASEILDVKQMNLFMECCDLLHKILLTIAREVRECQPEVAVNSCKVALIAAIESGKEELVAEAQFELGKSLFFAKSIKEALNYSVKSLKKFESISDPIGICNTHLQLANVYKEMEDNETSLQHLKKYMDAAKSFQLPSKLAEAHYLTGEYYLSRDNEEATSNFETSLSLYQSLRAKVNVIDEMNRARCLTGVSRGQQLLEAYRALIKQCIGGSADATLRILHWKDRGVPFHLEDKPLHEKS